MHTCYTGLWWAAPLNLCHLWDHTNPSPHPQSPVMLQGFNGSFSIPLAPPITLQHSSDLQVCLSFDPSNQQEPWFDTGLKFDVHIVLTSIATYMNPEGGQWAAVHVGNASMVHLEGYGLNLVSHVSLQACSAVNV